MNNYDIFIRKPFEISCFYSSIQMMLVLIKNLAYIKQALGIRKNARYRV